MCDWAFANGSLGCYCALVSALLHTVCSALSSTTSSREQSAFDPAKSDLQRRSCGTSDAGLRREMERHRTFTLSNGVEITFRIVRPDDARALQRVHARCSERTIYLRFFGSLEKLSDQQAQYFASTDGVDHLGLVALDPQDINEIIAVARYARQPGAKEQSTLLSSRIAGRSTGWGRS
jgi:hypothetical protein